MKRRSSKKTTERPKRSRAAPKKTTKGAASRGTKDKDLNNLCYHCLKSIDGEERALFVEEEIGRIFCSETCIADYFTPEIQKLEKEYFKKLSPSDLSGDERESLAHLRWLTLQEPDEVWREKTLSGDFRFTLISEFQPEHRKIWCICICLCLRGEPSFLYLAFPTGRGEMADYYRKGERMQVEYRTAHPGGHGSFQKGIDIDTNSSTTMSQSKRETEQTGSGFVDGLADEWTEDETLRAQLTRDRNSSDIPVEEFSLYQSCLEETLEAPDEVWSMQLKEHSSLRLYHFLRNYPDENPGIWYIVIARETEDEEQIEILDAFPTRDSNLVDQFRRGQQEVGTMDKAPTTRVVH